MTTQEWLEYARQHQDALLDLISRFHPACRGMYAPRLPITAAGAEAACAIVRSSILKNWKDGNPTEAFKTALALDDASAANSILSSTWFGVPESTSCWNLRGFSQAVNLLEETPDDGPEEPEGEDPS